MSIRGQQNWGSIGRGGVQVYSPGRPLVNPVRQIQQAAQGPVQIGPNLVRSAPGGGAAARDILRSWNENKDDEEASERLKEAANQMFGVANMVGADGKSTAPEEDQPWYKDTLGFLVGNSVTQAALKPLELLDHGRRALVLGVEEAAKILPEPVEWMIPGAGPLLAMVDEDREDDRSNWEKFRDPSYGYGQISNDVTWDDSLGNFFDRGTGFAGDVALDPLTYVAGVGLAAKGGTALSKGVRAGMARQMIDAGIDVNKVEDFVRRGAGGLTQAERDLAGIGRAGVRMGTQNNNFVLPFTERAGEAVSRATGAAGNRLRSTGVGQRVAGWRTPERIEDAYDAMFFGKGKMDFATAAERVEMENSWRAIQNTFRQVHDRSTRSIRHASKKLNDDQRAEVIKALESPESFDLITDSAAREVAKDMREALDRMWLDASERGLNIGRISNYSPHILTRDAAKWMREQGSERAATREAAGLVKTDLFDPSGVTMARQFEPGQVIEVNGQTVTLGDASVFDVNSKFREAGLSFDFFETDPAVILQKYVNMLSSDVGQAGAILRRVNKGGGVRQLTPEQADLIGTNINGRPVPRSADEALAQGIEEVSGGTGRQVRIISDKVVDEDGTVRYTRATQELGDDDLARASEITGVDLDDDLFSVSKAKNQTPATTKSGKIRLTKQGKAKHKANQKRAEDGEKLEAFTKDDFVMGDEVDATKAASQSRERMIESAGQGAKDDFDITARQVEEGIEGARESTQWELLEVANNARAAVRRSEQAISDLIEAQRSGAVRKEQVKEYIDQIDEFNAGLDNSINSLDAAVSRSANEAERTAVRDTMEQLLAERERLRKRSARLADEIEGVDPNYWGQRAEKLRQYIYGDAKVPDPSPNAIRTRGDELRREWNNLRTRIANGDTSPATKQRFDEISAELDEVTGAGQRAGTGEVNEVAIQRTKLQAQIDKDQKLLDDVEKVTENVKKLREQAKNPVRMGKNGEPHRVVTPTGDYKIRRLKNGEYFVEGRRGENMVESLGTFKTVKEAHLGIDSHLRNIGERTTKELQANAKSALPKMEKKLRALKDQAKGAQRRLTQNQKKLDALPAPEAPAPRATSSRRTTIDQTKLREMEAEGGGVPNVSGEASNSRNDLRKILDDEANRSEMDKVRTDQLNRKIIPMDEDEIARLEKEIAGLERELDIMNKRVAARKRGVQDSKPVKNAKARLRRGNKMKNNAGRRQYVKNDYEATVKRTEEAAGIPDLEKQAQRIQDQINARKSEIHRGTKSVGTEGLTPEQSDLVRKTIKDNTAVTKKEQLSDFRNRAAGMNRKSIEEAGEIVERFPEVEQGIDDLVKSQDARDATRQQARETASADRLARQEPQRVAIQRGKDWAQPLYLSPRRKKYIEELAQINEDMADRMVEMDSLFTVKQGHAEVEREARETMTRLNKILGEIEGGKLKGPAKPKAGRVNGWEEEARQRIDEIKDVLDSDLLDPEVRAATLYDLNKTAELLEEAAGINLTAKHMRTLRADAKSGRLGRMVEVQLADGWSAAYPHLVGEDVVLSAALEQSFKRIREAAFHKDFIPFIDTFTNLFKTYATATPGFHVRNAMSAAFMNATDGVSMATQYEALKLFRKFRQAADPDVWLKQQPKEIQDAFEAAFGSGIGGRYTEPGIGTRGSLRYKAQEKAFDNKYLRALGERPGANVEGIARLAPALHTIRAGGSVDEALARITRLHFDYSQMSSFDRNARRLIPFWTFMSRNLPLQISQMYVNPRAYSKFNNFVRNIQGERDPNEPGYFESVGAFPLGAAKLGGLPLYLQPDLAHSRIDEDLDRLESALSGENVGQVLSDFNPLFTAPLEYVTDTNLYTGRKYQPDDYRSTGPLDAPFALLGQLLGQSETTPDGQTVISEKFLDTMASLVPLYDRSTRLLPGLSAGESDDKKDRRIESYGRFMGLPIRQLSQGQRDATQRQRFYDQLDQEDLLRALEEIDAGG